jgi:cytochrome c biogenesis protein CcdA
LLGSWLFFTALRAKKSCIKDCTNSKVSTLGYLGIGFFSSFSFCAPMMSLVLLSSTTADFSTSLLYGISFGLGVVLIPFLFFYLFIFKISSSITVQLAKYKKHIEIFASLLLIIIGFLVYYQHLKL